MKFKRFTAAAIAAVMAGTTLVSCSQPNLENLLPFNEDKSSKYTSVVENSALTLYVDANANDGGDGSEASPFKTIPEAQVKIREIKAGEGLPVGGVTVLVKDGEYRLDSGLVFTEEDSGTAESPITYVSESEFGAVLTGGLILSASDFEPLSAEEKARLIDYTAKEKVVKVDLKKYGLTEADWGKLYPKTVFESQYENISGDEPSELFINGKRVCISRWPNEDFLLVKDIVNYGDFYITNLIQEYQIRNDDQIRNPEFSSIVNPKGATFTVEDFVIERMKSWQTVEDVFTRGYFRWGWYDEAPSILTVDFDKKSITHAQAIFDSISVNGRFWFDNIFEEMDVEREYYIDRENGILYVYKTKDFNSAQIELSTSISDIVKMTDVSFVALKGFKFCTTRGNGISATGNNLIIDNCNINNIRGYGVYLAGNNNAVQNCDIANVGSYGISMSGGDISTLTPSGSIICNNYIHDFGQILRTYNGGVHIAGCGITVSHNELANAPHMAIGSNGPNHIFEYNEIYNVCLETSDCGAVYCGLNYESYGTVFRYNFIHDIGNDSGDSHGIYWDDGLSGQAAYGNIMLNIQGHSFLIGGGRDNTIENNVIINSTSNIHCDTRVRDGILYDGWFDINATIKMSEQIKNFKQNIVWLEAFPSFNTVIPYSADYAGDENDPNYMINPSNNIVKNNIVYFFATVMLSKDNFVFDIVDEALLFFEPKNNYFIQNAYGDFPHLNNEDYTISEKAKALELCPDFEPIPFDKIGRID
ncbi:MAG: right-handed parallel beta-helix repeat-containing protein [Clostridia bacterium]|nr:right-handed parallel beta-helix repeat-containing protein [Clostridia bacterium]